MIDQAAMNAQAMCQKEDLRVESPGFHILVKIGQIGIISFRFVKRVPLQFPAEQIHQGGFAHANIASDSDKFFHSKVPSKGILQINFEIGIVTHSIIGL